MGFRGRFLDFLESFLLDRRLCVKINSVTSSEFKVNFGVPQGSVLGPLIFILYVNDLPKYMNDCKIVMYADDTSILITALDYQELKIKANNTAMQFKNWCARNRLIVNVAKTVCLNFQLRAPADVFTFDFESTQIVSCEQTKFLGVITDAMLSWNDHMNAVVKSINTACFAIVRLRDALDRSALLSVYYALVHSYLNYAICLWGSATNINRVFVSQKRIIRLIFGLNSRDSCRSYFKMFRILNVPCLFTVGYI